MDLNQKDIRSLIETSREPLIFRQMLKWNVLKWSLNDWCEKLGDTELKFRLGKFIKSKDPQWEKATELVNGTFRDFLEFENKDNWLYFDYKYLKDWLNNINELQQDIQWKEFGFDDLTYKDCTIWIGNTGAHTPCHIDTYGFNLVAQIYGRKQWFLFPSNEDLQPTRIPYEESSIYSKFNFFSPNYEQLKNITDCKMAILNQGDVLFVPQGWWHYVENLEIAISINTWIPLDTDVSRHIDEALVQILITNLVNKLDSSKVKCLLDNFEEDAPLISLSESCKILKNCIDAYDSLKSSVRLKNNFDQEDYLVKHSSYILKIPTLTKEEFKHVIFEKSKRICSEEESVTATITDDYILKLLEAVTHPEVISLIKQKLLN